MDLARNRLACPESRGIVSVIPKATLTFRNTAEGSWDRAHSCDKIYCTAWFIPWLMTKFHYVSIVNTQPVCKVKRQRIWKDPIGPLAFWPSHGTQRTLPLAVEVSTT